MIKLIPVKDRAIYHQIIYKEIKELLDRILFNPIIAIARGSLENDISSQLITALRTGKITYAENYFTGKFNSAIGLELRKIGATWDKGRKAYYLPKGDCPVNVKIASAQGLSEIQTKIDKIKEHLSNLNKSNAIESIHFDSQFEGILLDIDKQFTTTVPKDIGLPMTMTVFQREAIKREYTENLNKYIKDMTIKSTERLREKVIENVQEGYRASNLMEIILAQKGVSDRHALFLAKQETSLMVSTYRDSRYKESGITEYVWSTSHDSRVRPDHKKLDGRRFKFSEPPVTDSSTGQKNNPGFDYGCRCIAIPILQTDKYVRLDVNKDKSVKFAIKS
jgi:SPP1 gp7 family putative phage head morphogenesis protein